MIYISAQPDTQKFYWQLLVQVYNFQQLGIPLHQYHIVMAVPVGAQPSQQVAHLRALGCQVFCYPYRFGSQAYVPALRPHILAQHWAHHPGLAQQAVFYFDSDVIFREIPRFSQLPFDGTWYVSDTRDYLDTRYIRGCGEAIFLDMLGATGMDAQTVVGGDSSCGGAQYVMDGATTAYWKSVEKDCIALWHSYHAARPAYDACGYAQLQIWCADMWAVLWNAWRYGFRTEIRKELDFAWATSSVAQYEAKPILHMAGVAADNKNSGPYAPHFDKAAYNDSLPFGQDHSWVSPLSASSKYVALLSQVSNWVPR